MDIVINKYVLEQRELYGGYTYLEHTPFQSEYTKEELYAAVKYLKPVLDTGLIFAYSFGMVYEIYTIQEWFTKYSVGPKETREDLDKKIQQQYMGDKYK